MRTGMMRGGRRLKPAGFATAGLAAVVALLIAVTGASAAATVNLGTTPPASPVHIAVGDQIVVTLPPFSPQAGFVAIGDPRYPLPTTSNAQVLQRNSAGYQSDGTMVAVFQGVGAGTATINTTTPEVTFCSPSTTTTSTTSSATSSRVPDAPQSAPTSSTTSTSGTAASPPPFGGCASSAALYQVTVVVSAAGVRGVSTPATGTSTLAGAGIALGLIAAGVTVASLAAMPLRRRFRNRGQRGPR